MGGAASPGIQTPKTRVVMKSVAFEAVSSTMPLFLTRRLRQPTASTIRIYITAVLQALFCNILELPDVDKRLIFIASKFDNI